MDVVVVQQQQQREEEEECIVLASSISSETSSSTSSSSYSLIAFALPHFNQIRRFKAAAGTHQSPSSVTFATSEYLFQIHAEKNVVDVFNCPGAKRKPHVKDQRVKRYVLNGKPTAICATKCGSFVAVGFQSGDVTIWERSTGKMRAQFNAHFKRVVKMTFTSDGSSLITCSEDTVVSAWSVVEALNSSRNSNDNNDNNAEPTKSWTSHQLQVTDVCCSKSAGCGADLVASCSVDRTLKVFSMTSGTGSECLATFGLPKALTAVCMDGEDRCVFVGSCDGEIYEVNINGAPVVVGGDVGGANHHLHDAENDIDDAKEGDDRGNDSKRRKKNESFATYRGHDRAIVSLHCTSNGHHLLSTSEDGTCRLWDRASGKCIKTVKHPRGDAPIASACLAIRSHVEKVVVNVGGSNVNTNNNNNTNSNNASTTVASTMTTTTTTTYPLQKSSTATEPDSPLGAFERYRGGTAATPTALAAGENKRNNGDHHPWDGPIVKL
jgi:WD40 repeat protein